MEYLFIPLFIEGTSVKVAEKISYVGGKITRNEQN